MEGLNDPKSIKPIQCVKEHPNVPFLFPIANKIKYIQKVIQKVA